MENYQSIGAELEVRKTWLPTAAGVLTIISGFTRLFGAIMIFTLGWLGDGIFHFLWYGIPGFGMIPLAVLSIVAVPVIILSVLSIVGGVYAIMRRRWSLALTGSVCSAFLSWFLGVPAIILTALSRKEFT